MKVFTEVVVVLHLLGMAAIVGGWLGQRPAARRLVPAMLWGARAQLVTGIVLAGLASTGSTPPNNAKLAVKLLVALAVAACAEIANARQNKAAAADVVPGAEGTGAVGTGAVGTGVVGTGVVATQAGVVPVALVDAAFWLAVLNVAIATLWRSYS